MTHSPVFWRQLPEPVSGARNWRQSSGTRNYDTLCRQMISAKKKTNMDSDFEEDGVIVAVAALRLLKKNSKEEAT